MNTAMDVEIILFYKFTDIRNPEDFAGAHLDFCKSLGLLGKVFIAKEGINGSFSGSKEQIERYKAYLTGLEHFSNIIFKEEKSTFSPLKKMVVRGKN